MSNPGTKAILQFGRGIAYPFRYESGAVPYNVSDNPTAEQVRAAISAQVRCAVRTYVGTIPFARDEGHALRDLVGKLADEDLELVSANGMRAALDELVPCAVFPGNPRVRREKNRVKVAVDYRPLGDDEVPVITEEFDALETEGA